MIVVLFIPEDDSIQQLNARIRGMHLWALLPDTYGTIFHIQILGVGPHVLDDKLFVENERLGQLAKWVRSC